MTNGEGRGAVSESIPKTEIVGEGERRTSDWYELFFDLVFVAVIALSAHLIEVDPRFPTVLVFLLLFFPLWWAWVNLMVANNLYGARFPALGGLFMVAMPGPAMMAVAIANGVDHYGWLYALGAAWIRLMMLSLWLIVRAKGATRIPVWRLLTYNLGTAALWLGSIAVPAPWEYLLWALAIAIEVFLLAFRLGFSNEVYEHASVSHSMDRVGLFVVIVIGEAVYLSMTGLAAHPTGVGAASALFGFIVCALLARAFFQWGVVTTEIGLAQAQRTGSFGAIRDVVLYLPFLLVAGLTLISAVIGIAVEDAGEPMPDGVWELLAVGIASFYLVNAIVGVRLGRPVRRIVSLLVPAIGLPTLACFLGASFPAWVTLAFAATAMALIEVLSRAITRIHGAPDGISLH